MIPKCFGNISSIHKTKWSPNWFVVEPSGSLWGFTLTDTKAHLGQNDFSPNHEETRKHFGQRGCELSACNVKINLLDMASHHSVYCLERGSNRLLIVTFYWKMGMSCLLLFYLYYFLHSEMILIHWNWLLLLVD